MSGFASRFRQSVRRLNSGREVRRRRFTESQRREALSYLEVRIEEGASVVEVADELALGQTTLIRWRQSLRRPSFVQVEAETGPASESMTVVSPGGYRVEGVSVEQVTELLSRLG